MSTVQDNSVQLIVTSPPYPMVGMWDEGFIERDPSIDLGSPIEAYQKMHRQLDAVWAECVRVLEPGGIACINIGDATRTLDRFRLYNNSAPIVQTMTALGMDSLPSILWRKPTNAPSKFMGSGMLPGGAYVTMEREDILVFRKGARKKYNKEQAANRRRSSYFWEERNVWFSDLWTGIIGVRQDRKGKPGRERTGAFPLEIPYRLIQMYSSYGDTVLDPFTGTGTTQKAAAMSGRSSIGFDCDGTLRDQWFESLQGAEVEASKRIANRLKAHNAFVQDRLSKGKEFKHRNPMYDFPVMTSVEKELLLDAPSYIVDLC